MGIDTHTPGLREAVASVVFSDHPAVTRIRQAGGSAIYGRRPRERDYPSSIRYDCDGNDAVRDVLNSAKPSMIARLGDTELRTMTFYLRWRSSWPTMPYPVRQSLEMTTASGFFPHDAPMLDRFARLMIEGVSDVDVLGVWFNRDEHVIVKRNCPQATLIELGALHCMCYPNPWSSVLEGRRVLVVHPFTRSIETQYRERRTVLFRNPLVLPEFDLQTYAPVQTVAGNPSSHASWFEALEMMQCDIAALDFDVAIIGAGAYGLPLAAHIKRMGRQAVHLGGATQLLFGIRGRRWDEGYEDSIAPHFNDYWIRPSAAETPRNHELVDRGAYW